MFDEAPRPEFRVGPADFARLATMTGLEAMQAVIDGDLAAPSMAQTLNFWVHEVREGFAEFRGSPGQEHMNPMGLVHGGWAMTVLDSALGCAAYTTCAPGEGFVSMDTSVKFVRPLAPDMGQLRATATLQTRGRRIANIEGRIESRDGKVLALGTSSCFIQTLGG